MPSQDLHTREDRDHPHRSEDRRHDYKRQSNREREHDRSEGHSSRHRSNRHEHDRDRHYHHHHRHRQDRHSHRSHRSSYSDEKGNERQSRNNQDQDFTSQLDTRPTTTTAPTLQRDDWMLGGSDSNAAQDEDMFSTFGYDRTKASRPEKADPEKLQISSRELNPMFVNPPHGDASRGASQPKKQEYGAPGYKWRLMKLQRTYDMADQRGVPVEEIALERYGSMDAFNEARAERQFIEDRDQGIPSTQVSKPSSSSAFRRPGQATSSVPSSSSSSRTPSTRSPAPSISIPSVMQSSHATNSTRTAAMSISDLNKLEAQVLRAELTNRPDAANLRSKLEEARSSTLERDATHQVEVVPVLDGYGRLYDLGTGTNEDQNPSERPSKRSKVEAEPEDLSLSEIVRQEKFSAGRADHKDADAMLAHQIMADQGFENDLDYMDDEAKRFSRKKMKDDAMKRLFAVQDFARTKRALDECPFCWQDDGRTPPQAHIVSSGTCVYLALPDREPLVEGHCWIVPMQHHISSLDVDEDGWTEIRNFMKCLISKAAAQGQSMVFFETVMSLRQQKHTYLEAIPLPNDVFSQVPAYFQQALSEVESEWADHKSVITFSESRPFQGSMVSRLPYFMIQWDYKGQRGYGHVIESRQGDPGRFAPSGKDEVTYEDGDHVGGTGFPKNFAHEILGNMMDLEPYRWRRPKHLAGASQQIERFQATWAPYDWTQELS